MNKTRAILRGILAGIVCFTIPFSFHKLEKAEKSLELTQGYAKTHLSYKWIWTTDVTQPNTFFAYYDQDDTRIASFVDYVEPWFGHYTILFPGFSTNGWSSSVIQGGMAVQHFDRLQHILRVKQAHWTSVTNITRTTEDKYKLQ